MEIKYLKSECLICGKSFKNYDTNQLYCPTANCINELKRTNGFNKNYVSILPCSNHKIEIDNIPSLHYSEHESDFVAITAIDDLKAESKNDKSCEYAPYLPFEYDYLKNDFNLSCGNPVLLRSWKLQTELKKVDRSYILDCMSSAQSELLGTKNKRVLYKFN